MTFSFKFWNEYLMYGVFVFDFIFSFNRRLKMNRQEIWYVIGAVIAGLVICILIDNPHALSDFVDHALSIPMDQRHN